jgi:hypothetical protein
MVRLSDHQGRPEHDVVLQDWIDRHMHGMAVDDHPGGRIFTYDVEQENINRNVVTKDGRVIGEMDNDEMKAVQAAREELRKIGQEVNDYRDELRYEAVRCHQKHGQPSLPGKPCIDYQAESKRIGRKDVPKESRQHLCLYCPYESSVTVTKRARRGDYAEGAGQRRRR